MKDEWTEGLHTVEEMKPTAHAVKQPEMAVKRAYQLNAALIQAFEYQGGLTNLLYAWRYAILTNKDLFDLFGYDSPQYVHRSAWEWTVRHWYNGGLKRSVEDTMHNLTSTNKKAIQGKIDDLYSGTKV